MSKVLPILFAFLWATGFFVAKYALQYTPGPYTLVALRFLLSFCVMTLLIIALKPPMPVTPKAYFDIVISGLMIHALLMGGVFTALSNGAAGSVTAVIIGIQPVLTTLLILRLRSWRILIMTLLGFIGLVLVVLDSTSQLNTNNDLAVYWPVVLGLFGLTLGTIYQKNHCAHMNVLTVTYLQLFPVMLVFWLLTWLFEPSEPIQWTPGFFAALFWLAVVLSIGTIVLMNFLYQRNSASMVANYFFLSPPMAMVIGLWVFDEPITLINCIGVVLIVISIYSTNKLHNALNDNG